MTGRDNELLEEIEKGALDDETPIASVLRKCIALGGRVGSAELRDWARQELGGYDSLDTLPPYRLVPAGLFMDAQLGLTTVRGQQIGIADLPEEARDKIKERVPLGRGIAEIEDVAKQFDREHIRITVPGAMTLARLLERDRGMDEFEQITAVYWSVSRMAYVGIVDRVRTACVGFAAELRAALPTEQSSPTKSETNRALKLAVEGTGHTINIVHATASGGATNTTQITNGQAGQPDSWWGRWRKRGIVVGIATVVAAVSGVGAWLKWDLHWPF